jgi:hypothetical protein
MFAAGLAGTLKESSSSPAVLLSENLLAVPVGKQVFEN